MDAPDRRAPCPCGSGKKYKSCCYPRDQAHREAREAARAGLARIDGAVKVVLPLVEAQGRKVACHEGCNACCYSYVRATLAEALLAADHLRRPEQAAARARFLERLPAWREKAGDDLRNLDALLAMGAGTPAEGAAWEAFHEASVAYLRRRNLCPFNEGGRCDIYPVRPTVCRSVYVVDTADYCQPDQGRVALTVRHPALDQALREASPPMVHASQRAGDGAKHALPELVARLLG